MWSEWKCNWRVLYAPMAIAQSETSSRVQWAASARKSPKRWNCGCGAKMKKRTRQRREAVRKKRPMNNPFEAPTQSTRSCRDLLFQIESSFRFSVLYLLQRH